jgi:hypothetical protein
MKFNTISKPNNISKKKITDTFPTSVEYYGQFHK